MQCWNTGFSGHAPCWNQVRMCVQIRPIPSTLRVFNAGTRYFFNQKVTGSSARTVGEKSTGQKAGSVEKKGKQVVETPRVLTPRC